MTRSATSGSHSPRTLSAPLRGRRVSGCPFLVSPTRSARSPRLCPAEGFRVACSVSAPHRLTAPRSPRLRRRRGASLTAPRSLRRFKS